MTHVANRRRISLTFYTRHELTATFLIWQVLENFELEFPTAAADFDAEAFLRASPLGGLLGDLLPLARPSSYGEARRGLFVVDAEREACGGSIIRCLLSFSLVVCTQIGCRKAKNKS